MVDDKAVQLLPLMESNLQLGPAGNPHPPCFDEGNSTKMMIFEEVLGSGYVPSYACFASWGTLAIRYISDSFFAFKTNIIFTSASSCNDNDDNQFVYEEVALI